MQPSSDFSRLTEIMAKLRDPDTGCPWDLEQDFRSIRHYTIEEAYEVADAIEREDFDDLKGELGDLLLQPVYHAQMAAEAGHFEIGDVIQTITEKLVRRHPHVFGPVNGLDVDGVNGQWDAIKAQERDARAERRGDDRAPSLLDDVPSALPSLARAEKLTKRAANVGFDWASLQDVTDKVREELVEVEEAIVDENAQQIHEEIGDLLFAVVNLARKAGVPPEAALSDANAKFTRRFHYVEARCAEQGHVLGNVGLEVLDQYWNEIRADDKSGSSVLSADDTIGKSVQKP